MRVTNTSATVALIPAASRENWTAAHFAVSEEQSPFDLLQSIARVARYIPPGRYMSRMRDNKLIMSTTPSELCELHEFCWRATDDTC
jgi:hypothetical protein